MRPEESLYECKMILVSIRDPEEIPWFSASQRAIVAAIFTRGWGNQLLLQVYLCDAELGSVPRRADMIVQISRPGCLFAVSRQLFRC